MPQQHKTASWINKLRVMHMIRQTATGWNIRKIEHPYARNTITLRQKEWAEQRNLLQQIQKLTSLATSRHECAQIAQQHFSEYPGGHGKSQRAIQQLTTLKKNIQKHMAPPH